MNLHISLFQNQQAAPSLLPFNSFSRFLLGFLSCASEAQAGHVPTSFTVFASSLLLCPPISHDPPFILFQPRLFLDSYWSFPGSLVFFQISLVILQLEPVNLHVFHISFELSFLNEIFPNCWTMSYVNSSYFRILSYILSNLFYILHVKIDTIIIIIPAPILLDKEIEAWRSLSYSKSHTLKVLFPLCHTL